MSNPLNIFKPELNQENKLLPKKILLILEGQLELKYIYKLFKIVGYLKDCDSLDIDCVVLSWGKKQKIENCDFDGGSFLKGFPTPKPALESYYKEMDNFWLYSYIIVLFDSDRDKNDDVKNKFLEFIEDNNKIILLTSNPCFESTLIDYCCCGIARQNIDNMPDGKNPCDKYKNNFSKLGCFVGRNHLIQNLDLYTTKNIILNTIQYYINDFFVQYCKRVDTI